jgi:uncharacterized protein (TIGR02147 family)
MSPEKHALQDSSSISVYDYTDYRRFLRDSYEARKKVNPAFSHRMIGQKAGFKSNGHFARILGGSLNLSGITALKLAEVFRLNPRETRYFLQMTHFAQAKKPEDVQDAFEKLLALRQARVKILQVNQHEFYRKWHHSALREALLLFPCKDENDLKKIAKKLIPQISPAEARESLDLLIQLGLVARAPEGHWAPQDAHLTSGKIGGPNPFLGAHAIHNLSLAMKSVNEIPIAERNHSSITMTLSGNAYSQVVDLLRETRKRIQEIVAQDAEPERVFHLNMSLFPQSVAVEKRKS